MLKQCHHFMCRVEEKEKQIFFDLFMVLKLKNTHKCDRGDYHHFKLNILFRWLETSYRLRLFSTRIAEERCFLMWSERSQKMRCFICAMTTNEKGIFFFRCRRISPMAASYGFDDNILRLIAKAFFAHDEREVKLTRLFSSALDREWFSSRWVFLFRSFFHCQHDEFNLKRGKRYRGRLASDHVTLSSLERFLFNFHSFLLRFSVRFHLALLVGEILVIFHMNGDLITRWWFDYWLHDLVLFGGCESNKMFLEWW